jgi:hypothetical protein
LVSNWRTERAVFDSEIYAATSGWSLNVTVPNEEQEFVGVLVIHWEVGRFCVVTGRRWFGLLPRVERWLPHLPADFSLEKFGIRPGQRDGVRYLRLRVRGVLGPEGDFGHRGICSRELTITKVLEAHETTEPGPTW